MEKIVLTEKQQELIKKHLDGEYDPFLSTEEEQIAFNEAINMADDLVYELDEYDQMGGDLIKWFWDKYNSQEADNQ